MTSGAGCYGRAAVSALLASEADGPWVQANWEIRPKRKRTLLSCSGSLSKPGKALANGGSASKPATERATCCLTSLGAEATSAARFERPSTTVRMTSRSWLRNTSFWPRSLKASNLVARKCGADRCRKTRPSASSTLSAASKPARYQAFATPAPSRPMAPGRAASDSRTSEMAACCLPSSA